MFHFSVRALFLVAGSILCVDALAASRPAAPVSPPLGRASQRAPLAALYARIEAAMAAAARGDHASARLRFDEVAGDALFGTLTRAQQREVLSAAAIAAWHQEDLPRAAELLRAATVADGNVPDDWYRLAILELQLGQRSRAMQQVAAFARRWPALVNNLDRMLLIELLFRAEPREVDRLNLMDALFDAGWNDNERKVDDVWRELALLHLTRGAQPRAHEVLARISDPLVIAAIRSDKRFDALQAAIDGLPTVEAAAAANVARLQDLTGRFPKRIDLASDLGTALLVVGRDADALAVSEAMLTSIDDAQDTRSFAALDDRIWVMNNKAIALRRAGRFDEAAAQFKAAGELGEGGGDNVSQRLNLGTFLCAIGRPTEALAVIEPVGDMSGYGRMVQTAVQHCAALQRRDAPGAARALAYLYDHRADSREIVVNALLRANDIERAASELIRALEHADDRAKALEYVQEFRTPMALPAQEELRANRTHLLARADVQAAIDRVGRVLRHEVFDVSGID